jgi:hypothetical protein
VVALAGEITSIQCMPLLQSFEENVRGHCFMGSLVWGNS